MTAKRAENLQGNTAIRIIHIIRRIAVEIVGIIEMFIRALSDENDIHYYSRINIFRIILLLYQF